MPRLKTPRSRTLTGVAVLAALCALTPSAVRAKDLALVIGNQNYLHMGALTYALNDAQAYREALETKGFETTLALGPEGAAEGDLDWRAMGLLIEEFVDKVEPGDRVVVVFSGHGWSDGRVNYLTPIDMPSGSSMARARQYSFALNGREDSLMERLEAAGAVLRVAIIDACRDNSFESALAAPLGLITKGVSRREERHGEFIIYAAQAEERALDRLPDDQNERHSLFTRVFLPYFREDISLRKAFEQTKPEVARRARAYEHAQNPDYAASGVGAVCLSEFCNDLGAADGGAQTSTPPAPLDPAQQAACEAASLQTDPDRPFGLQGVAYAQLKPERHVEACEIMVRAPEPHRLHLTNLARLREKQDRGAEAMSLARRAAGLGSTAAMNLVGSLLETGAPGVARSPEQATAWYRQAADAGNAVAMYNLSLMYAKGLGGLQQSEEQARFWRDLAVKDGDPFIMNLIACAYSQGSDGLPQDKAQAVLWWEKAAAAGNLDAKASLGWAYLRGEGVARDPERGFALALEAAQEQNPAAMNTVGFAYAEALGVARDDVEAFAWWTRGAEAGNAMALSNLGWAAWHGRGVTQSDAEAVKRWREALALEENAFSMRWLGWAYWVGRGVERQDEAEAVRLWRKAAALEDAGALSYLGRAYWIGRGVERQSDAEAVRLWREALKLDEEAASAMVNLGWAYWTGRGVERQDASEAVRLWNEALKLDEEATSAMVNLGEAYWDGGRDGVGRDPAEALRLWRKAADLGNLDAMVELGEVYRQESDANLKDEAQTLYWWTKAADLDSARAMRLLWVYRNHFTPPLDAEKVKIWLLKAVELGDDEAVAELGEAHYHGGSGFPPNQPEGMRMLLEAAEAGNRAAMWSLTRIYEWGDGSSTPPNREQAIRWKDALFETSGFITSDVIGSLHFSELIDFYSEIVNGAPRNIERALYLLEKTAERGNLFSMGALGIVFSGLEETRREDPPELTFLPPPDPEKALFWLRKALAHPEMAEAEKAGLQEIISRVEAQAQ